MSTRSRLHGEGTGRISLPHHDNDWVAGLSGSDSSALSRDIAHKLLKCFQIFMVCQHDGLCENAGIWKSPQIVLLHFNASLSEPHPIGMLLYDRKVVMSISD